MDEDADIGADDELKPAGPPKTLLLLNLALSAAALGGVGFLVMNNGGAGDASSAADQPKVHTTVDPMVVNLNDEGNRYLKIAMDLELLGSEDEKALENERRATRDTLLPYLSNLTVAQTRGADNRQKIRDDIVGLLTDELGEDRLSRIYITEFVVQ